MDCCLLLKTQKQIITTYWGGYFKNEDKYPQTLNMTPDYVDIVILAFIGPNEDSTVETTFLCSIYSDKLIKQWILSCQNKGIKVYASILDTPTVHWDKVDLLKFSKSLKSLVDNWNLDGIDIDAESSMDPNNYVNTFINLANNVKNQIGNLPLTYTCYTGIGGPDGQILNEIKNKITHIQLMSYFTNFDGMVSLYNNYKQIMNNRIIIGVKAGGDDGTPLDEVTKLCLWNQNKVGIMLWTINRDTPQYTNMKLNTWITTIKNNLNLNIIFKIFKYIEMEYIN
jgi:chitinase